MSENSSVDMSHLEVIQIRLYNEGNRLTFAKTQQERVWRTMVVNGIKKELADERHRLGLDASDLPEMSDDEILTALGVE